MLPELNEIKKRRKNLGITQKQLAKKTGISQSLITKIETQRTIPTYNHAKKIFETIKKIEETNQHHIKAKDIHTTNIKSVKTHDTISTAIAHMKKHSISQLPVYENAKIIGSLTEKTIINIITQQKKPVDISKHRIRDLMEKTFPIIDEQTNIDDITYLLLNNQAIMTIKKGIITGIITRTDILKININQYIADKI